MERTAHEVPRQLPKGAVIHIKGLPFRLAEEVIVYGHPANIAQIPAGYDLLEKTGDQ